MNHNPKQQIIDYLLADGYQWERSYAGRKYRKLVRNGFTPIFVGRAGAFRRGTTIADSVSITDALRRHLNLPIYGDNATCETCRHTSIHEHRLNRGCHCGCQRYTGTPGWTPAVNQ